MVLAALLPGVNGIHRSPLGGWSVSSRTRQDVELRDRAVSVTPELIAVVWLDYSWHDRHNLRAMFSRKQGPYWRGFAQIVYSFAVDRVLSKSFLNESCVSGGFLACTLRRYLAKFFRTMHA